MQRKRLVYVACLFLIGRFRKIPKYGQIRTVSRLFRALSIPSSPDVPVLLLNLPGLLHRECNFENGRAV